MIETWKGKVVVASKSRFRCVLTMKRKGKNAPFYVVSVILSLKILIKYPIQTKGKPFYTYCWVSGDRS